MLLYEANYKEEFDNKIRAFDTDKNTSVSISIPNSYEFYERSNNGSYISISDKNLKFEKKFGKYKDTENKYSVFSPAERYIRDNFWKKSYNSNPRIWYMDIETRVTRNEFPTPSKALEEISLIQIFDNFSNKMIILGYKDFKMQEGYSLEYDVRYIRCTDENDMISKYQIIFNKMNPLIIYAWNGNGFDYPYIFNRLNGKGINASIMSNYGNVSLSSKSDDAGRISYSLKSPGHYYLDLMEVYKKFTFSNKPSYSLDSISKDEIGDQKVDHSEFMDFDSLYTGKNYSISDKPYDDRVREEIRQLKILEKENKEFDRSRLEELITFQFVYYGIKDVYLLKKIDDKRNFTKIMISIANEMGCSIEDTLGTLKPWGTCLKNLCYENKLVIPPKVEHESVNIVGGFVREPEKGIHEWLLSEDANSMYPMLSMKGFNMSVETYVPKDRIPQDLREHLDKYYNDQDEKKILGYSDDIKNRTKELLNKYNFSMGINGAVFDKAKIGIIPETVANIYFGRKADKKKMLKYEQQSEVIKEIIKNRNLIATVASIGIIEISKDNQK